MNKKKPPITAIEIMIFQCRTPNKEKFTNLIRGNHNLQCEDSHQQREDPFIVSYLLSGWEVPSSVMEKEHDVTDDAQI